jgi:predicted transcriptional regulator
MKVLWRISSGTVAQVRAGLSRPLAYTTVMTVLDRLSSKGVVDRRKNGRAYHYTARLELDAARHAAVNRLLDNLFENDRAALMRYLSSTRQSHSAPLPAGKVPRARSTRTAQPQFVVPHIDETLL